MELEEYKELMEEVIEVINEEGPLSYYISENTIIEELRNLFRDYYDMEETLDRIGSLL